VTGFGTSGRGLGYEEWTLKGKPGALMGPKPEQPNALLSPVATAVESLKPMFKWRAIAGAQNYVVTVYDADAKKVVASDPLTETKWQCRTQLIRGRTYSWQVRANVNGKELIMPSPAAAEAKFRLIDDTRFVELTDARRRFPASHLLLGILYAESGLLEQSERELRNVVQTNPKSAVARSLLMGLISQRKANRWMRSGRVQRSSLVWKSTGFRPTSPDQSKIVLQPCRGSASSRRLLCLI
jgi:hypothetical protein